MPSFYIGENKTVSGLPFLEIILRILENPRTGDGCYSDHDPLRQLLQR